MRLSRSWKRCWPIGRRLLRCVPDVAELPGAGQPLSCACRVMNCEQTQWREVWRVAKFIYMDELAQIWLYGQRNIRGRLEQIAAV